MRGNISFEFSGGGVVIKDRQVLLINTKNLKGNRIWTFPKGKIERGEDSKEAALREVMEETGYRCSIEKELKETKYIYENNGKLIIKKVKWFLMTPIKKEREHDSEVEQAEWKDHETARRILEYGADLNLLNIAVYK